MPKCRCKPDCKLEIEIGAPIVYVSFFKTPKATAPVALEHLRQSEIQHETTGTSELTLINSKR